MKKFITIVLLFSFTNLTYAGIKALTWHSRANCGGFNESVTWQLGKNWTLVTISVHTPKSYDIPAHTEYDHKRETWRSIAYHFPESLDGNFWFVDGKHQIFVGGKVNVYTTYARDCNIYDGWWDQDFGGNK